MEDFKSNTFSKLNIVIEQKVNSKAVPEGKVANRSRFDRRVFNGEIYI